MKVKTIDAVNAYKEIKDLKMTTLSEEVLVSVWKNIKALRPIAEEYDKDVEAARKTLENDEHAAMVKRLQEAIAREKEVKEGKRVLTAEEQKDVQEINKWFEDFQARGKKFFDEIAEKEVKLEISKLPDTEILKALKDNGKTFDVMERLAWMIE